MNRHKPQPSPTRAIGPRETAFLRGEPIGDFEPMPCYAHGRFCECARCLARRADNFELADAPDLPFPQTMRYEAVVLAPLAAAATARRRRKIMVGFNLTRKDDVWQPQQRGNVNEPAPRAARWSTPTSSRRARNP